MINVQELLKHFGAVGLESKREPIKVFTADRVEGYDIVSTPTLITGVTIKKQEGCQNDMTFNTISVKEAETVGMENAQMFSAQRPMRNLRYYHPTEEGAKCQTAENWVEGLRRDTEHYEKNREDASKKLTESKEALVEYERLIAAGK